MKKVIVTGGCGYIGSHVARAFKQDNDQVYIIDRVYREHTLKDIDGYYIDDFASDASLATIADIGPDVIVHCAGTSLVGPSMTDPAEYYNNNIVKTIRMLDFLKDLEKKPAIMFSSSASVYGEPEILPIAENSKIQPISPYGSTKAMSEFLLRDYGNAYGFDTVCFRYFNAAGAEPFNYDLGQEPNATHIVARVLEASINQKPFTLYGRDYPTKDGTCIRDYVHVWDIAQAHVAASRYLGREDLFDRTVCNLVLNLGTNKGISNQEIIDYVKKHQGLDSVKYEPRRWGDPAELIADATVAKDLLGWRPMFSDIETIIDSAYKWYTR